MTEINVCAARDAAELIDADAFPEGAADAIRQLVDYHDHHRAALDTLRGLHRFLYPENYVKRDEPHQWSSETTGELADRIEEALQGDPELRSHPVGRKPETAAQMAARLVREGLTPEAAAHYAHDHD